MIGNNKIVLNQSTMQEAVQYWLDSKSIKPLSKVGYIGATNNNAEFTINLAGEETVA